MGTVKYIDDVDIWEALGRRIFPYGIPPEPGAPTDINFSGGYPSDHRNPTEHGSEFLELHWNFDFTPEQEEEWERIISWAKRKGDYADDEQEKANFTKLTDLKAKKGKGRNPQETAQALDDLTDIVEMLMGEQYG